jgi:hypothetical protein
MTRLAFVAVLFVSLAACSRQVGPSSAGLLSVAPGEAPAQDRAAGSDRSVNRYLAYEHSMSIEADNDDVMALFDAAQDACREAVAESCAILEARISKDDYSSATLKFRATAAGIHKLRSVVSSKGKIANQSTTAEDLAGPIEDTNKKLAMLADYRAKLEGLLGRSNNDVDALIKLNRELADVQSQIESLSGEKAHLVQRVETEILNVSISSYANRSFWSPIGDSVSSFGENLSEGIGSAIIAVAYLIPWSLVLLLFVWGARKLWNRRKKPASGA